MGQVEKTAALVEAIGNLTGNLRSVQTGVSARAYRDGYWGFASAPADDAGVRKNRYAMLARLRGLFINIADISVLG